MAEALCALTLGGILAAAAGGTLAASRRALETAEDRERGGRAEREAVHIVRQALQGGEAVVLRGDTAVELDLLVGAAVVCAVETHAALVPWPSAASGLSAMPQLPTPEDLVAVRGWSPAVEDWWYGVVDSVQDRRGSAACAAADGWRAPADSLDPLLRIVFSDSLPSLLEAGADLRVYRRGRFALYHIGRGEWALGWRRCHPWTTACTPIQPVVSPLLPPGAGGFRVTALGDPARWVVEARGLAGRGARAELSW